MRPSTSDGPYKNPPTEAPVKDAANGDVPKALSKSATTDNEAKASAKAPITTPKDTPAKAPIKTHKTIPAQAPTITPKDIPAKIAVKTPSQSPQPSLSDASGQTSVPPTLPVWLKWLKSHWLPSLMWPLVQLLRTWCPSLTVVSPPSNSETLKQPAEPALSEGAFVPNYDELSEAGSEAPKSVQTLPPTLTLGRDTVRQLIEWPNPGASANAAVARQLVMTNHHLISVTEKLGNSDTKSDRGPDDHVLLVKIESHLAGIDKSLKKQELAREQDRKQRIEGP